MTATTIATTNLDKLTALVQNLTEDQTCPVCKDKSLIRCPDHLVRKDEDGWCTECDTPDAKPGMITCPCQHLSD